MDLWMSSISKLTLLQAPNNDALTPPKHHHHGDDHDAALFELAKNPSLTSISALLDSPAFVAALDEHHDHGHGHHGDHGDHDHDDKKKKEIIKYIIGKVLQYHGLTKAYTAQEIAENSTIPTALKADDGSYGGLHRRIKVEKQLLPPGKLAPLVRDLALTTCSGQAQLLRQGANQRQEGSKRIPAHP